VHKITLGLAALLVLGTAIPVLADGTGTAAGVGVGATAGFFIAGPVGAVVGGLIGAGVGDGVSNTAEGYARDHREASITYDGTIQPGYRVGHGLHMYAVPNEDKYSYVYVNDHPVLIDNQSGTVVWVGN
jgi:hypothetical protein